MEKKTFAVLGMMCAGCAANVERRLNQTEGVQSASVNLPARTALVEYDNAITSPEQLKAALSAIGYDMVIEEDRNVEAIEQQAYRSLTKKVAVSWGLALLVMAISMHWLPIGTRDTANQTMLILALLNLLYPGRQFFVNTIRQLRHASANMDTLVALRSAAGGTCQAQHCLSHPLAHGTDTQDGSCMHHGRERNGRDAPLCHSTW